MFVSRLLGLRGSTKNMAGMEESLDELAQCIPVGTLSNRLHLQKKDFKQGFSDQPVTQSAQQALRL